MDELAFHKYLNPFGNGHHIVAQGYTDKPTEFLRVAEAITKEIQATVSVHSYWPNGSNDFVMLADFHIRELSDTDETVNQILKSLATVSHCTWSAFEGCGFLILDYNPEEEASQTYALVDKNGTYQVAFDEEKRRSRDWLNVYRIMIDSIFSEHPDWISLTAADLYATTPTALRN